MTLQTDKKYILKTFRLAQKGAGLVSPNPMVGALLVKNGKIIGSGYHERFGSHHAEINAIKTAIEDVSGATLYVNLEPCSHTAKKTPPCVPRIIKERIKRVVISTIDPNPREAGRGVKVLQDAGIEVVTGILEEEGTKLNKFFFKYIKQKLPFVTIKVAQTINGYITDSVNHQIMISGRKAQRLVHKWRSQYDAVLVGANTVRIDNPQLNVRAVRGRNPRRIILNGAAGLTDKYHVFDTTDNAETHVFVSNTKAMQREPFKQKGIVLHTLSAGVNSKIGIDKILRKLASNGISSVLVEGGSEVFSQFLSGSFWDELKIFVAPKIWQSGVPFTVSSLKNNINNLHLSGVEQIDDDLLISYRRSSTKQP
jgi:diaminohydroxyphosphoribosylaminopyrimidine deaminase/5-amino-6-(5-phosphoribosylamino)uracil reductase